MRFGFVLPRFVKVQKLPCTAGTNTPSLSIFGIRPKQVTHWPVVGHLLFAIYGAYLVKSLNTWRQSSVHAKDASVNDGRETQVVEDFSAISPYGDTSIFTQTFIVKTVDLGDLTRLMIPSNQCDSVWISDLQKSNITLSRTLI